jgi:anthranilate phosphoribosyltransferase
MSEFSGALQLLLDGQDLSTETMLLVFRQIMTGQLNEAQIAAFVIALRCKGETVQEVAAAARVMRELVTPVLIAAPALQNRLVDLCGTGGDSAHTFNISTAAMFVAAAAGVVVAKHGGRSVSSASGSADVLEAMGANIALEPAAVARCLEKTGVGFMFAPNHHSAMKYAAPVRKALGVRTVFNILGPLTNPAGAKRQLMGVFRKDLLILQAKVLQQLGSDHVMVVHGVNVTDDKKTAHGAGVNSSCGGHGMDEMVLCGPTRVAELKHGQIIEYDITPESVGLKTQSHEMLAAASVSDSKNKIVRVLRDNPSGVMRDIVVFNAGAAIYVGGQAQDLREGVQVAQQVVASGAAWRCLQQFIQTTQNQVDLNS